MNVEEEEEEGENHYYFGPQPPDDHHRDGFGDGGSGPYGAAGGQMVQV